MKNIDSVLAGITTPSVLKTAFLAIGLTVMGFGAIAQENNYTSSIGDYCSVSENDVQPTNTISTILSKEALQSNMKDLFEEQVALTHSLIQNLLDGSSKAQIIQLSLLQNQEKIADQLAPFYGKEAAAMLTALMYQHVVLTADMVVAVRDGDVYGTDMAMDKWRENGKQIAAFLNETNPSLRLIEAKQMVNTYLKSTVAMGEASYKQNIAGEMKAYGKALEANMAINSTITDAIIRDHSDKFNQTTEDTTPMVTQNQ